MGEPSYTIEIPLKLACLLDKGDKWICLFPKAFPPGTQPFLPVFTQDNSQEEEHSHQLA